MRLLDLFCGEGGAGAGYHDAGFRVFGVDNSAKRLDRYPFPSQRADAIEFLLDHGDKFDAIHASPPCTGYTRGTAAIPDRLTRYDRLIAATREALQIVGKPYIIENVADARRELRHPVLLCGRMFGLGAVDDDDTPLVLDRHRLFEASEGLTLTPPVPHEKHDRSVQVAGAYGGARRDKIEARHVRKGGYVPKSLTVLQTLLDTPWMTEEGCFLSIPPVYTRHLGTQLRDHLETRGSKREPCSHGWLDCLHGSGYQDRRPVFHDTDCWHCLGSGEFYTSANQCITCPHCDGCGQAPQVAPPELPHSGSSGESR